MSEDIENCKHTFVWFGPDDHSCSKCGVKSASIKPISKTVTYEEIRKAICRTIEECIPAKFRNLHAQNSLDHEDPTFRFLCSQAADEVSKVLQKKGVKVDSSPYTLEESEKVFETNRDQVTKLSKLRSAWNSCTRPSSIAKELIKALEEEIFALRGCKFSDRDYSALKYRAEKAEQGAVFWESRAKDNETLRAELDRLTPKPLTNEELDRLDLIGREEWEGHPAMAHRSYLRAVLKASGRYKVPKKERVDE